MVAAVVGIEAEVEEDTTEGEDRDVIIHTDVMIMVVDGTLVGIGDMMIAVRSISIYIILLYIRVL